MFEFRVLGQICEGERVDEQWVLVIVQGFKDIENSKNLI